MLTADHVRARRKGHDLKITTLSASDEAILLDTASRLILSFERSIGRKRDELNEEIADVIVQPRLIKALEGLKKLLFDRSEFASPKEVNPSELRALVFAIASKMRAELEEESRFERQRALIAAAAETEIDLYQLDDVLYADLKGEQRLTHLSSYILVSSSKNINLAKSKRSYYVPPS